jgi:hypothetical protein
VDGWCSVEELVQWGFGHAPVVMANEAHNGRARCIRTRETGIRRVRAAHEAGVRRLAMEALPWPARDVPGPIRAVPPAYDGYLAQPDMRRLIATALELGWSLWVSFQGQPRQWVQALLAEVGQTLAAHDGTAGILRDQAPAPLNGRGGVDAVVVSTENALT